MGLNVDSLDKKTKTLSAKFIEKLKDGLNKFF